MRRGWNISNENLKEIYEFIDNYNPKNDTEKRNKKILQYAFIQNKTALEISELNDKDIVCFSNRAKGKQLSNDSISRIIRSYNLVHTKRIDYSKRKNYERRKKITKKIQNKEIIKPLVCACCGNKSNLELHHVIPISLGGNDEYYNLIYLCFNCHRKMHKYILDSIGKENKDDE